MTCVTSGPRDAVVTARALKDGVELTVKSPSGQVKLVHLTPFTADGDLSSIDVVRASSLAVKAIESNKPIAPKAVASAPKKSAKLRLLAHR